MNRRKIAHALWLAAAWMTVALPLVLPFRSHTRSLEEMLVYGAPGFLILASILRGADALKALRTGPLRWPVAAFCATALLAATFSMARDFSVHELRSQLLKFVCVCFAAWNVARSDPRWLRRLWWSLFGSGVAAGLYGIVGYVAGFAVDTLSVSHVPFTTGRALGPLESYTRSSMFYLLWIPFGVAMAIRLRSCNPRAALGAAAAVLLVLFALALTGTRGTIACAILATGATAFIRTRRALFAFVGLCATAGVAAFLLWIAFAPQNAATIAERLDAALSGRITLWHVALDVVTEHPLTGIGYGSDIFQEDAVRAVYPLRNAMAVHADGGEGYQPDVHQFYLQLACEGGVPHLIAAIWLFGAFLVIAARGGIAGKGQTATSPELARASLFAVGFLLIYGLVGHFHETRIAMTVWMILAVGCAAAQNRQVTTESCSPESE